MFNAGWPGKMIMPNNGAGSDGRSIFFDLEAASDGDGEQSTPYNSLKYLQNPNATIGIDGYNGIIPQDYDTYYIKGYGVGANSWLNFSFAAGGSHDGIEAKNVTICGWPGGDGFELSAFVRILHGGSIVPGQAYLVGYTKTPTYVNIYERDLAAFAATLPGAAPTVSVMAYNYADFETPGTNGKITPANVWMVPEPFDTNLATTLTNMDASAGTYYFDSATNKLYIHAPGSADPSATPTQVDKVAFYDFTRNGIISIRNARTASNCQNWAVKDIVMSGAVGGMRTLECLDSDGFALDNFEVRCYGDDAVAMAGSGARGTRISNGLIAGQTSLNGAFTADTGIVFYSDNALNLIDDCTVEDVNIHHHIYPDTSGVELYAQAGVAMATHGTFAELHTPMGLIFRRCETYSYNSNASVPIRVNGGKVPTDKFDWTNYSVIFEDCRFYECHDPTSRADANGTTTWGEQAALIRCYLYSLNSNGSYAFDTGSGCTWYSEFSIFHFVAATAAHIAFTSAAVLGKPHEWVGRCNLYITTTATAACGLFVNTTPGVNNHFEQGSVMIRTASTGRFYRSDTGTLNLRNWAAAQQLPLWFYQVNSYLFTTAAAQATYIAAYDAGGQGIYGTNPNITLSSDPTVVIQYEPTPGGNLDTLLRTAPALTGRPGFNGNIDSGKWGPYQ